VVEKKCEKVVAEITLPHLMRFAHDELGQNLSREEALLFLNQNGRAYQMWQDMMQAGEHYIKSVLYNRQMQGGT